MESPPTLDVRLAPRRVRVLTLALGVVALCVLINRLDLGHVPHGWDEVSYEFQARVFASGRLCAPGSPFVEAFANTNVISMPDRRFSQYPPGWPLLLAPAVAVGLPELANALLAGAGTVLLWRLARRLWGEREAWLAAAAAALSPFYVFMGASWLAHTASAVLVLAALVAMLRSLSAEDPRHGWLWALLAGALTGWAGLVRPYSALLGLAGNVWIAAWLLGIEPRRWVRLGLGAAPASLACFVLLLAQNAATTGDPWLMAYRLAYPRWNFFGMTGGIRGTFRENLEINLPLVAKGLSGHVWGTPWLDAAPMLSLMVLAPRERHTWALIGAAAVFSVGQSLYFYFDYYHGPRMIFETLPWMFLASARAVALITARRRWMLPVFGTLFLLLGPLRSYPATWRYRAANYCGQGGDLIRAVEGRSLSDALVFVRSSEEFRFAYANLSPLNALDLAASPVLFARFDSRTARAVADAYPRHEQWVLDVDYEPLPGHNVYNDRFRLLRANWTPLSEALGE